MSDLILVLIFGLAMGLLLGTMLGMNLTTDSDDNIRLRSRSRSAVAPRVTLPTQASAPLNSRLTSSSNSPQLIQRTEVYRLDAEDEAGHVCRFCGLDLGQFDHTDCRRGIHGND